MTKWLKDVYSFKDSDKIMFSKVYILSRISVTLSGVLD
jgi:hypothetical protein